MSTNILYEPMVWSDVEAVIDEFDAMWGECSAAGDDPEVSRLLSAHFVLHYLEHASQAEVAYQHGEFMGVLMTAMRGRRAWFPQVGEAMKQIDSQLNATKLGAASLAEAEREFQIERDMERQADTEHTTGAEITLFLVAEAARGKGVGGTLWRRAMSGMDSANVQRFYLHTDSSCDVDFYRVHGMQCLSKRDLGDPAAQKVSKPVESRFLYAGTPQRAAQPSQPSSKATQQ